MKKIILAVLLSMPCFSAFAGQSAILSWVAPTEREDNSALSETDITGYNVYYSIGGDGSANSLVLFKALTSVTSHTATLDLVPGPEPVTVYFAITTLLSSANESNHSEIKSITFVVSSTAKPKAPTAIQIEIKCGDGSGCSIVVVE